MIGRLALALLVVFAWALISGGMDERDHRYQKPVRTIAAQDRHGELWLRLPLECEQWIAMRGAGQQWRRKPVCADFTTPEEK